MRVIGITGGVGAGKSQVLAFLECTTKSYICQADEVARILQNPGESCYRELVNRYGKHILHSDGTLDRSVLSYLIFKNPKERLEVNRIVHPAVKSKIRLLIKEEARKGTPLFFLEAALLIEDDYDEICDELWYICTNEKNRRNRLMQERGYSAGKVEEIMAAQSDEATFRKYCKTVIDNNGDFEHTKAQLRTLLAGFM